MTEIVIPFNTWARQRLKMRLKTATTRPYKAGDKGDNFRVGMTDFIITDVLKLTLGDIARDYYKNEGCNSPSEFIIVWHEIYKSFDPVKPVWIHFFKEVQINNGMLENVH